MAMTNDKEEGYTCDGSIKGIKGVGKPKNCMECWFSDWRGQETHGGDTTVLIHCDVKHRYKDRDKREPYVFNAETHEPKFPDWCPVVWRDEE